MLGDSGYGCKSILIPDHQNHVMNGLTVHILEPEVVLKDVLAGGKRGLIVYILEFVWNQRKRVL